MESNVASTVHHLKANEEISVDVDANDSILILVIVKCLMSASKMLVLDQKMLGIIELN